MELRLGSDGVFRDGGREIGRLSSGPGPVYATLTVDGRPYEIMREGRGGWRFSLHEPSGGATVCEFKLARLRRGGTLRSPSGDARIGTSLAGSTWKIELPGYGPITVRGRPGHDITGLPGGRTEVRAGMVQSDDLLAVSAGEAPLGAHARATLLFACWLIREWRMVPSGGVTGGS